MATVDMNLTQFYRPPSLNPPFRWGKHSASSHTNSRRSLRAISSLTQVASPHNDLDQILESSGDELDDDVFPTAEELLRNAVPTDASTAGSSQLARTLQQLDNPAVSATSMPVNQTDPGLGHRPGGSRDRPVVIEDDEPDSTDDGDEDGSEDEAEATPGGVDPRSAERDASPYSALLTQDTDPELSKPFVPSGPERRYEPGYFVDGELPPGLELEKQQGPAVSTPAHDHHYSPGSYHQIHQHNNDGNPQRTSEEPAPHSLPKPLDEDGEGGSDENVSETSHSRLEELGFCSPPHNQDQDEEEPQEQQQQQQQQQQEVAAEAMREEEEEEEGDDGNREREQRGEKRRHQDEPREVIEIYQSEGSDCSHNTNNENVEEDEDDEEPRSAKRRKLPLALSHEGLTPPLDYNSKAYFRQPYIITPPLVTQLEVDDTQPHADPGNLPTPVDDKQHHFSRTSRSPSAPTESVPIAEYHEWPFQGFLKRTRIGNETTYNLEFRLPYISKGLNLPINPEASNICSSREALAKAAIPHEAAAHSKMYLAGLRPQIKRAPWTPEEDATLLQMRNNGCSWENIHAALPHRSKGTIQVRYSTKLKR